MMKWYFAMSQETLAEPRYADMAKAAVASARLNTTLKPNLIFGGVECEFTQQMRAAGVNVILHESQYKDIIYDTWESPGERRIALGAFLRLDVPLLETTDDYVLYTDCDTLFFSDPKLSSFKPEIFSVAPEFELGDYAAMNTGVMVLNVQRMRRDYTELRAFAEANRPILRITFDQSLLREFYAGKWDFLPPTLNWKPYWGPAKSIEILHFHGPKPHTILDITRKVAVGLPQILLDLVEKDHDYCVHMANIYFQYLYEKWPKMIE